MKGLWGDAIPSYVQGQFVHEENGSPLAEFWLVNIVPICGLS